jgi:hypothetical protein
VRARERRPQRRRVDLPGRCSTHSIPPLCGPARPRTVLPAHRHIVCHVPVPPSTAPKKLHNEDRKCLQVGRGWFSRRMPRTQRPEPCFHFGLRPSTSPSGTGKTVWFTPQSVRIYAYDQCPGQDSTCARGSERVAVQAPDLRKHARRCPVRARTGHSRVRSAGSAAEQCGLWRRRATWSRPEDHPLQDSGRSYQLRLCCAGKRGLAIRRRRGRDVGLVCGAVGP